MDNVIPLPTKLSVTSHYREKESFTEGDVGEDEIKVVLASQDETPGMIYVMLVGSGLVEVLETFRDN